MVIFTPLVVVIKTKNQLLKSLSTPRRFCPESPPFGTVCKETCTVFKEAVKTIEKSNMN